MVDWFLVACRCSVFLFCLHDQAKGEKAPTIEVWNPKASNYIQQESSQQRLAAGKSWQCGDPFNEPRFTPTRVLELWSCTVERMDYGWRTFDGLWSFRISA